MIYKKLAGFTDEASDSLREQIEVLNALKWNGMELRCIENKQLTDLSDEEFEEVRASFDESGIHICSIGSNIANWGQSILAPFDDTKKLVTALVPRARMLGAEFVRIMSYKILTEKDGRVSEDQHEAERFKRLNWITQTLLDNGLTPVHENCFTYGGLSYEHTLKLLDNVPGLRLVFDTGNPPIDVDARTPFPYSYQDSWEFYRNVKPYIVHVHIKDSYVEKGKEVFTFPGEGHGFVKRIVSDLLQSGYDGWFSMEPHMETVFHDKSVVSTPEARKNNFMTYAHRFEDMLREIENLQC